MPSGLRPVLGGAGRRENVHTESKICRLLAEMTLSAVRKNPRKHAVVGKKKPTPEGWFFLYWWCNTEPNPRSLSEADSNRTRKCPCFQANVLFPS